MMAKFTQKQAPQLLLLLAFTQLLQQSACQTYWTDAFDYLDFVPKVQEGAFKALFESPNDPQMNCWTSLTLLKTQFDLVQSYSKTGDTKFNNFFPRVSEVMNLQTRALQFYQDCQFDYMLVEVGKRANTISGFLNMLVNILFRYIGALSNDKWQAQLIAAIDKANISNNDDDWEVVGSYVGQLFAEFMDFSIPDVTLLYNAQTI